MADQITPADSSSTRPPAISTPSQGQPVQCEIAPAPEGGRKEGPTIGVSGGCVAVGLGVSVSGATMGGTVGVGVKVGADGGVGLGVSVGVSVGVPVGVGVGLGLGLGVGVGVVSSWLVNVHFTTSSSSSLNVALFDATLPELGFAH